jgi:hypothetical protein
MGNCGPGPRRVDRVARLGSTVDRWHHGQGARQHLAGAWCVGAQGHRGSSAVAREDEGGEVNWVACLPEHGGGMSSMRGRRRTRESLGKRGKGVVRAGGALRRGNSWW